MFKSLKGFADDTKLGMGLHVDLLPAEYLAIAKREDIGQTPFADTPALIRDHLKIGAQIILAVDGSILTSTSIIIWHSALSSRRRAKLFASSSYGVANDLPLYG